MVTSGTVTHHYEVLIQDGKGIIAYKENDQWTVFRPADALEEMWKETKAQLKTEKDMRIVFLDQIEVQHLTKQHYWHVIAELGKLCKDLMVQIDMSDYETKDGLHPLKMNKAVADLKEFLDKPITFNPLEHMNTDEQQKSGSRKYQPESGEPPAPSMEEFNKQKERISGNGESWSDRVKANPVIGPSGKTAVEMLPYIGTKIVKASPMNLNDFQVKMGKTVTENDAPGYIVEYEDGYESWSPAPVFERSYRRISIQEAVMCGAPYPATEVEFDDEDAKKELFVSGEFYPGCSVKVWETGGYNIDKEEGYARLNVLIKIAGQEDRLEFIDLSKSKVDGPQLNEITIPPQEFASLIAGHVLNFGGDDILIFKNAKNEFVGINGEATIIYKIKSSGNQPPE